MDANMGLIRQTSKRKASDVLDNLMIFSDSEVVSMYKSTQEYEERYRGIHSAPLRTLTADADGRELSSLNIIMMIIIITSKRPMAKKLGSADAINLSFTNNNTRSPWH
uniref:Uncharacterized protein n=1 Tax=Romanomermis culicivorax TaxID=13658 RepID=A0A915KNQ6_ROMCU